MAVILEFKSTQDALQGVSLLDYKFKTSRYQVYKVGHLQQLKNKRNFFLKAVYKFLNVDSKKRDNQHQILNVEDVFEERLEDLRHKL